LGAERNNQQCDGDNHNERTEKPHTSLSHLSLRLLGDRLTDARNQQLVICPRLANQRGTLKRNNTPGNRQITVAQLLNRRRIMTAVRGGETAVVSATMKFLAVGNGAGRQAWRTALAGILLGALAVPVRAQTQYAAADIEYGSRVYAAQCAVCHGATGDTVNGVDLKSGHFKRASLDYELMAIVTTGIEGTAMPAFKFSPAELTGVIAYVRNMRDFRAARVALGDAARGQALFDGKGRCGTCHRVNGNGPRVAPDLSSIGANRTADMLQRAVVIRTALRSSRTDPCGRSPETEK
jgi:mono/diheme cytochrome c family protein